MKVLRKLLRNDNGKDGIFCSLKSFRKWSTLWRMKPGNSLLVRKWPIFWRENGFYGWKRAEHQIIHSKNRKRLFLRHTLFLTGAWGGLRSYLYPCGKVHVHSNFASLSCSLGLGVIADGRCGFLLEWRHSGGYIQGTGPIIVWKGSKTYLIFNSYTKLRKPGFLVNHDGQNRLCVRSALIGVVCYQRNSCSRVSKRCCANGSSTLFRSSTKCADFKLYHMPRLWGQGYNNSGHTESIHRFYGIQSWHGDISAPRRGAKVNLNADACSTNIHEGYMVSTDHWVHYNCKPIKAPLESKLFTTPHYGDVVLHFMNAFA